MSQELLVARGRYQPFGHHHAAVIDYFMDKHDADELNVVTEGLSKERTPTSPFYGYETAGSIKKAFEEDYNVKYDVDIINQEEVFDDDVFNVLSGDPIYFTREESHAYALNLMKVVCDVAFWNDLSIADVDYEPREDPTPFERFDKPVETSSTNIRQMIDEGNDEWRRYVPDSVEDLVDEKDKARDIIGESPNNGKYADIAKHALLQSISSRLPQALTSEEEYETGEG